MTAVSFDLNNRDVIVTNFSSSELVSLARNASKYEGYKLETVFLRGSATYIDGLSTWILHKEDMQNVHNIISDQ